MSILDQIVRDTRQLVQQRKSKVKLSELEGGQHFDRELLDFAAALRSDEIAIISEIKKASPSQGVIRDAYDPTEIAKRYEDAGAAAISVLTEPNYFQGSLDHLAAVRGATSLPLLRKDFVVDVYQLFEARAYGADGVLLIAAVLDRIHLRDLVQAARELGLTPLVEVYQTKELDRIDFDLISVLGVNNRDLRTFEVDVDHALRVFAEVPDGLVRVSESGISAAQELVYLRENGVDAALIGETFMRAEDPGEALGRLREEMESVRTQ